MSDELLTVLSKADTLKLSAALYNLVDAVKGCSPVELQQLHEAGRLPEGCMQFILRTRNVAIDRAVKRYGKY